MTTDWAEIARTMEREMGGKRMRVTTVKQKPAERKRIRLWGKRK